MDTISLKKRTNDNTPSGFTLVELLVVITIISILAALITVAAVGALRAMDRARIKADINEIGSGFDEYKNKSTAYPPNCQTDGSSLPLIEADILNDLRRHIKQVAPRSQESDNLARILVGSTATGSDAGSYPRALPGGVAAPEAVVFWLGGFSSDPKYPISGDGGPSYDVTGVSAPDKAKRDPIESREWVYPFDVTRLGPRTPDGYFDDSKGRYVEYTDPRDSTKTRRINFWQYTPAKSDQPYVYFDTSRHPAGVITNGKITGPYDPPAQTYDTNNDLFYVYAFKKTAETPVPGTPVIQYINPDKFQVFHCGIDNAWDKDAFKRMAPRYNSMNVASGFLLFPSGPFVGEFADTEVNFAVESTIEDAMK